MLNQTDLSWFLLWQLVCKTYCESVTIHQKKNYFGREIEGSSSVQRNFTWLILNISCHWIVTYSACSIYKFFENQSTQNVIFLLSLPLNFLVSLVLDTPEVPGSSTPFAVFILTKHFCESSNTYGSSTHSANIWHADKTEVVTVPFEKIHLLNDFFDLLYLKLWSENIFKTRLVSSEKYKPSFFS